MNYKITCHLMPWELDYALLSFIQLKKSKYYLDNSDNIYIDVTLNLSNYIINWDKSKLPKEFFINKFEYLKTLLIDYICFFKIYEGNELYGGLNTQRESTENHIDHYVILNPDMYFSENLLSCLIEGSKCITNEYFTITPQIPKLWDNTWDVISHPNYINVSYKDWNKINVFDVRYFMKSSNQNPLLTPINTHKWAGWMDLYNKKTWETFWVSHDDWVGYGACDWYTMLITQYAKQQGLDFQQYLLENQLICEYNPLDKSFSKYYKDMLVLNNIPNQREAFENKMQHYLNKGIQQLKNKQYI